jgi:hypothetical protein
MHIVENKRYCAKKKQKQKHTHTYVTYTLEFSFLCAFFGKRQRRFGEYRKTQSDILKYNVDLETLYVQALENKAG